MEGFGERILSGDAEGERAGVHHVSLPVGQHVVDSNNRVAGLRTLLGALVEGLLDGRNILVRDVLTLSLVNELA